MIQNSSNIIILDCIIMTYHYLLLNMLISISGRLMTFV